MLIYITFFDLSFAVNLESSKLHSTKSEMQIMRSNTRLPLLMLFIVILGLTTSSKAATISPCKRLCEQEFRRCKGRPNPDNCWNDFRKCEENCGNKDMLLKKNEDMNDYTGLYYK